MTAHTPIKLLLVDDDRDDYMLTRDLIDEINGGRYALDWVSDDAEVLPLLEKNEYGAVLVDFRLKGNWGTEVIRQARERGRREPMILITGHGNRKVDLAATDVGATDYLMKDEITAASLERTLRYAIERHRIDQALLVSEMRFHRLVEQVGIGIIVLDGEKPFYANPYASKMFGNREPANMLALDSILQRIVPNDQKRVMATLADCAAVGRSSPLLEVRARSQGGRDMVLGMKAFQIDWSGRAAICLAVTDETARKRAEREAYERFAQISHADRLHSIGELAAALADEISAPAAAIGTVAKSAQRLCADGKAGTTELLDLFTDIDAKMRKITDTIRRVRSFTTVKYGHPLDVEVNRMVKESVQFMEYEFSRRGITVAMSLAKPSPIARIERIHLQQVLVNLMQNGADALEDAPEDHRNLVIRTIQRENGDAIIEVVDTGKGIEPSMIGNVMNPLTTSKRGGVGLGLSTSRTIVEQYGGRLEIESKPRRGTKARIVLPKAKSTPLVAQR